MQSVTPAALSQATWRSVPDRVTVLVPVGSLEQHGPHLPLDTDTVIASEVATGAARSLSTPDRRVLVAPPLSYGSSGEHQSFAGTSSIGTPVLQDVLVELTRSVRTWAERVVFVNAHGGNIAALNSAVGQLRIEGHDVVWTACATEVVDLHAGRTETSLMLHLRPEHVRLDLAEPGNTASLAELLPAMRRGGLRDVTPNGVLGDPTGATAAEGGTLLAAMIDDVATAATTDMVKRR